MSYNVWVKMQTKFERVNGQHATNETKPISTDDERHGLGLLCAVADLGEVRMATLADVPYVVDLCKKETRSIGFIPKMAYESAITGIKKGKRWSDVCKDKLWVCVCNGDLVGFVLASFGRDSVMGKMGKVAQICLQTDARMLMRGRMLLDNVVKYGTSIGTPRWSCGCADDLESNIFWKAMGWVKVGERKGIAYTNTWKQSSDRKVNIYRFDLMDLFIGNGT